MGDNVEFILEAASDPNNLNATGPHDFGDRHITTVEPNGRITVYNIHGGTHFPRTSMIYNDPNRNNDDPDNSDTVSDIDYNRLPQKVVKRRKTLKRKSNEENPKGKKQNVNHTKI